MRPTWLPSHFLTPFPPAPAAPSPLLSPQQAQAKRAAIRATWAATAAQHHPGVAIRFVLAQPATDAEAAAGLALLQGEIRAHGDVIIVPGADTYRSLPNKTLQLLRYALSSPCRYTHVMKTDDDVHLRPKLLLDIVATGWHSFSVDAAAPRDPGAALSWWQARRGPGMPGRCSPWRVGGCVLSGSVPCSAGAQLVV